MVERLNGIEKVRGSTPLISTNALFVFTMLPLSLQEGKMKAREYIAVITAIAAVLGCGAVNSEDCEKPDVSYVDGAETFSNPARGYAAGGWTVFKPEGLLGKPMTEKV